MNYITVMKQALDALTTAEDYICGIDTNHARSTASSCDAAIEALRAAIAQDDGEPVAYSVGNTLHWHKGKGVTDAQLYAAHQVADYVPLSDGDIDGIGSTYEPHSRRKFARLVERAVWRKK